MGYPIKIKNAVLKQALLRTKSISQLAQEFGVGRSTISTWLRQHKRNGSTIVKSEEKSPNDWTPEERISAIIETGSMTPEERTAWCRKNGLFPHHLEQWKKDAMLGLSDRHDKKYRSQASKYKKEISSLKKDLNRKEKALAETAALLVLKKKAQQIWGDPEDE